MLHTLSVCFSTPCKHFTSFSNSTPSAFEVIPLTRYINCIRLYLVTCLVSKINNHVVSVSYRKWDCDIGASLLGRLLGGCVTPRRPQMFRQTSLRHRHSRHCAAQTSPVPEGPLRLPGIRARLSERFDIFRLLDFFVSYAGKKPPLCQNCM